MKEDHQQANTDRDNQIQALEFTNEEERWAHEQEILRLNDLIANRHIAQCGCFDKMLCYQKEQQRSSPILHYSMSVRTAGKT